MEAPDDRIALFYNGSDQVGVGSVGEVSIALGLEHNEIGDGSWEDSSLVILFER
jgi:hypothetical protein